jgi:hypothetical protein
VPKRRVQRPHAVKADLQVPGLSKAGSSLSLKIYASKFKLGEIMIGRAPSTGTEGIARNESESHGRALLR